MLSQGSWTIVAGELDPVTAEVADFLANARSPGRKLLVVLRSNEEELLSAETRAVLVAGLRSVDAVFIARDEGWRSLAAQRSVPVVKDDASRRRHDFEALVCAHRRS